LKALDSTALVLRVTGSSLGDPATDTFGPEGWFAFGPGQWTRPLLPLPEDLSNFNERVVALTYIEPGVTVDRHQHPTAHRFFYLSGEADDEMAHPDGHRDNIHRQAGDFVDYPLVFSIASGAQGLLGADRS
jgi:anti-sigma factor ChrR (cupin superfamily)